MNDDEKMVDNILAEKPPVIKGPWKSDDELNSEMAASMRKDMRSALGEPDGSIVGEVNQSLVMVLEELINHARSGRIQSIAMAWVGNEGQMGNTWASLGARKAILLGGGTLVMPTQTAALLGATQNLLFDMNCDILNDT